jgi:hypothetical protein
MQETGKLVALISALVANFSLLTVSILKESKYVPGAEDCSPCET